MCPEKKSRYTRSPFTGLKPIWMRWVGLEKGAEVSVMILLCAKPQNGIWSPETPNWRKTLIRKMQGLVSFPGCLYCCCCCCSSSSCSYFKVLRLILTHLNPPKCLPFMAIIAQLFARQYSSSLFNLLFWGRLTNQSRLIQILLCNFSATFRILSNFFVREQLLATFWKTCTSLVTFGLFNLSWTKMLYNPPF